MERNIGNILGPYQYNMAHERKRRNGFSSGIQKSRISDIQNIQERSWMFDHKMGHLFVV